MSDTWTIAQAAVIINKNPELLKKQVERAPIKPNMARQGRKQVYAFEMRDLIFYCALDDLKEGLTTSKQAELFEALKKAPLHSAIGTVEVGYLRYDFGPYVKVVRRNIEAVRKSHELIDRTGDEPVIKGTGINAYRIAALCEGMTVEEILADYPSLSDVEVAAAKAFAASHPKPGRPYPKITAKRALREARADPGPYLPERR
jgi:uncharacterized protein (DUF433 family)